jgi:general secretion pathway protein J
MTSHRRLNKTGFTLVEALVATALMGFVLLALATITSRWLPNWHRGFDRLQHTQLLATALQRTVDDIAASEFIPPNGRTTHPIFEGTSSAVIFVRSAIGPNAGGGLEVIKLGEESDRDGATLVRSHAAFAPASSEAFSTGQFPFADPVVLVRFPYRVTFSYAGRDRTWTDMWHDAATLPSVVRISVRDARTGQLLPMSTAVQLHMDASAQCTGMNPSDSCTGVDSSASDSTANSTPSANINSSISR